MRHIILFLIFIIICSLLQFYLNKKENLDTTESSSIASYSARLAAYSAAVSAATSATSFNADKISPASAQKYDSTLMNLDTQYHKSAEEIMSERGLPFGTTVVQDTCGNLVYLVDPQIRGTPIYYDSNNIKYNPQSYVPSYEDSIYLRHSAVAPPASATAAPAPNFCSSAATRGSIYIQETQCQSVSPDNCWKHNCCVNLGGAKCVAGNERGPAISSNYGDIYVRNRDYYYYKGICYGNCKDSAAPTQAAPVRLRV